MKKTILFILVLGIALAAFLVLGSTRGGDGLSPPPVKEKINELKVGVMCPLEKEDLSGGIQELLGVQYANTKTPNVNVDGVTYTVELIFADRDEEEQLDVCQEAQLLIDNDVSAVICLSGSNMNTEAIQLFEDAGIPLIGSYGISSFAADGHENCFSVCVSDRLQGSAIANYAYNDGVNSAAVLYLVGDTHSRETSNYFGDEFRRLGGEVVEISYNAVLRNFESIMDEISSEKVDMVFMSGYGQSINTFIKQAVGRKLDIPVMGTASMDTVYLRDYTTDGSGEIYFCTPFDEDSTEAENAAEFSVGFSNWIVINSDRKERNGGDYYVSTYSALGYDSYMMLVKAAKNAGSISPGNIAQAVNQVEYSGVTGKVLFSSFPESMRSQFVKTIDFATGEYTVLQTSSTLTQ